jgi:peptide-methionine (R)-S-oxide reductase
MVDDPKKMTDADWKRKLTPTQYDVLRQQGTEAPFTGKYVNEKADGMYHCAACGAPLFSSDTKFESGTGWPSFTEPALIESVNLRQDNSHGMRRIEVTCANCGGHLGHVFDDGPADKGGKRYCINSAALQLEPKSD